MKFWETPDVDLFIYRTALGGRCCRLAWSCGASFKAVAVILGPGYECLNHVT